MQDKMKSAVEAILFGSGEPVELSRLAEVLETDETRIRGVIDSLREEYSARGINVILIENTAQMTSAPEFAPEIRAMLDLRRSLPLSQAALEVLSVVAYNEPVTKAFIEGVRGVDCSGVLSSLMAKNLIEERGRLELPGRPLLYGTTPAFLRCMNLSSLSDLPPVKAAEPEEQSPGEDPDPGEFPQETDDAP